jgi:hypothetical protein
MRMDQLSVIFDIIGTPTQTDVVDIAPMASAQLVHQLSTMDPKVSPSPCSTWHVCFV